MNTYEIAVLFDSGRQARYITSADSRRLAVKKINKLLRLESFRVLSIVQLK